MLQGYNANSFQPAKQHKKRDHNAPRGKLELNEAQTNSNLANTQKIGQKDQSMTNK